MPYTRSFTHTGIDCMGPIDVVVLRCKEKLWICLFTCLTCYFDTTHENRDNQKKVFSDIETKFVKVEQVFSADMASINMKIYQKTSRLNDKMAI